MQGQLIVQRTLANGATGGFIVALASAVLATLSSRFSYQAAELAGLLVMIIGAAMTQAIVLLRAEPVDITRYLDRLRQAVVATIAMCASYAAVMWLYYAFINPDYLAEFFTRYSGEIMAAATSEEDHELRRAFIEENRDFILDPFKQAMLMAGTLLGLGGMVGIVVAGIVRRRAA